MSKSIFVVDDDKTIRALLELGLKKEGYLVSSFDSPAPALERLKDPEGRPALILSDWMMPGMNGVEFCQKVKQDPDLRSIFFILLTARTRASDKVEGLDSGADDYITKPLQMMELSAKVRSALRIRELQEELARRNADLVRLNALKDDFLGMAAHDLRNPLGVISLWTETMLAGALGGVSDEQKHAGEIILKHSDTMLNLINDLLDIAAIESGKVKLEWTRGQVEGLVRDIAESNRILAEKKEIRLEYAEEGPLPAVRFDSKRVTEVVTNLVSNAIKFTPQGGTIRVRASRDRSGSARIEVIDTGCGISLPEQARLFQKFERLSSKATAGERGTGLGLAIVKKLVELHGGAIGVTSVPGEGSMFWFTMPAAIQAGGTPS